MLASRRLLLALAYTLSIQGIAAASEDCDARGRSMIQVRFARQVNSSDGPDLSTVSPAFQVHTGIPKVMKWEPGPRLKDRGREPGRGPLFEQCSARKTRRDPRKSKVNLGNQSVRASLVSLDAKGARVKATVCTSGSPLVSFSSSGAAELSCCTATGTACAGCAKASETSCQECAGGFKSSPHGCFACRDMPGFVDPAGNSCKQYEALGVCMQGAINAPKFAESIADHIKPHLYKHGGLSAADACCACGGGMKASTPFRYPANARSFVLGMPMHESPQPRTATSFRVPNVLEGSSCNLHALGLSLNPSSGVIHGTPIAEEPVEVQCQIEALQDERQGLIGNATLSLDFQYFAYDAKVLSFPAQGHHLPTVPSSTYSQWRVACTPAVPWLEIDASTGALSATASHTQDKPQVPEAALCSVTAFNGTIDQSLSLSVVYPHHWDAMQMVQKVGEDAVTLGSVVDLVVGRAVPPVRMASADGAEHRMPPVSFHAACSLAGEGTATFDVTTGDVVVNGHVALNLDMLTGEFTGVPDMRVLGHCAASARCKQTLSCKIFGELAFSPPGSLPTFLTHAVTFVIRDDTCWQQTSSAGEQWKKVRELTGSGTCRHRCRQDPGCAAYQIEGSQCFAVRRVSMGSACPEVCEACQEGSRCTSYCSDGSLCTSGSDDAIDCRGCDNPDFQSAIVRVTDCDAMSSCLSLTKLGGGAAFLEGTYCPPSDGEKDMLVPYYAKPGEVDDATLFLTRWNSSRELHGQPCPQSSTWVVRRSSTEDFFRSDYVELRGAVLACIGDTGPSSGDTWGIGDAALDELRSTVQVDIVDEDYRAQNPAQKWVHPPGVTLSGKRLQVQQVQAQPQWSLTETEGGIKNLVVDISFERPERLAIVLSPSKGFVPQQLQSIFDGQQAFTSSLRRRYRPSNPSLGNQVTYVGFLVEQGHFAVITSDTTLPVRSALPGEALRVITEENGFIVAYLGAESIFTAETSQTQLFGQIWAGSVGFVELPNLHDEAVVAPSARQCANPLDDRRAAKSNAKEEAGEGESEFRFHDVDAPEDVHHMYSLSPCECFGKSFGVNPPVTDAAFSSMPAGSGNTYVPPSTLIVSGSLSCDAYDLMTTLVDVDIQGCEMACRSGDYDTETMSCNFYFTGTYTEMTVCRLYRRCENLVREVNSHGELYAVAREEACLIADPETCWPEKREKWLAGGADVAGDCMFEDLLKQCDAALVLGGNGISECGRCTHMLNSAPSVKLSKLKRPLPEAFDSGSALRVSCSQRFTGLDRFGSQALPSLDVICLDGQWVDAQGTSPGLEALQCVACVRATLGSSSSGLHTFVASSQQERWWLDKHAVQLRSWDGLCLASSGGEIPNVDVQFQDPVDESNGHRRRALNIDVGKSFGSSTWHQGLRYGWTGDGACTFDQQAKIQGDLAGAFSLQGGATRSETIRGLIPGAVYSISFQVRVLASLTQGVTSSYSSSSCYSSDCPAEASCPSGKTLIGCEAQASLGADTAAASKGATAQSDGTCMASGVNAAPPVSYPSNYNYADRGLHTYDRRRSNGRRRGEGGCPSGEYGVTFGTMWAGTTYGGYAAETSLNYHGPEGRRRTHDNGAKRTCPLGTYITNVKSFAGDNWDSVDIAFCSDGTRLDSGYKWNSRRRGRRRAAQDHWNNDGGTSSISGRKGERVDQLCIGGSCKGGNGGGAFSESCGSNKLVSGWSEYNRRRSVQFFCTERRPVVKKLWCENGACGAECANDDCKVGPVCMKISAQDVDRGSLQQSSGGGQFTPWSDCPSGMVAVGLSYLNFEDDINDARVASLHELSCVTTRCRAMSKFKRVSIRAACIRHALRSDGSEKTSNANSWSDYSGCSSGYSVAGVAEAKLLDDRGTMRILQCTSQGCRAWCTGGRCSVKAACVSAKVRAVASCSASHTNLIAKTSSTQRRRRSVPNAADVCPATHQTSACLCLSDSTGVCQSGSLASSTAPDSACSSSGTVVRLCTQGVASVEVTLGSDSETVAGQLSASDDAETVTLHHSSGSGTASLRFREKLGKAVDVHVSEVVISDSEVDYAKQSLVIDPDQVCVDARWEIEVPASEAGIPYEVSITYGDSRVAVDTTSCKVGTAGKMLSASDPDGVVPKNEFRTVKQTVFVHAAGTSAVGLLVFSGEAAAGCTSLNRITIERKQSVFWSPCGPSFSKAWDLRRSSQVPGNVQLASGTQCVDPLSGDMVLCVSEDDIQQYTKQVFSLDYLAPLVAKWTHFESGRNVQLGACVRARNKYLPNLDVGALVACNPDSVLSSFFFKQDISCNHQDDFRYHYTCTKTIPVRASDGDGCTMKATRCVALTSSHAHLWELDKHDVGTTCPPGSILKSFAYQACQDENGGPGFHYTYTCCSAQGLGECREATTEWGEVGDQSDLSALSHHKIQCPLDHGLRRFLLEAQVPEVAAGAALQGEVRYVYDCCALPLAPPVGVDVGPLLEERLQPWEGTYCATGDRVEGKASFARGIVIESSVQTATTTTTTTTTTTAEQQHISEPSEAKDGAQASASCPAGTWVRKCESIPPDAEDGIRVAPGGLGCIAISNGGAIAVRATCATTPTYVSASSDIYLDNQAVSASCASGDVPLSCTCETAWAASHVCGGDTEFDPSGNVCTKQIPTSGGRRRNFDFGAGAKIWAICKEAHDWGSTADGSQATYNQIHHAADCCRSNGANVGGVNTGEAAAPSDCEASCDANSACVFFSHSTKWKNCALCSRCDFTTAGNGAKYTSWQKATTTTTTVQTYPECRVYEGTVWAFCGETPIHRWGIGPEGESSARGNCNDAARNKRWGVCQAIQYTDIGDGFCPTYKELAPNLGRQGCFDAVALDSACVNKVQISYGKGSREGRCLCDTAADCEPKHGLSLGANGYDRYMTTTTMDTIKFDRLSGHWCLSGHKVHKCSPTTSPVAQHPVELPGGKDHGVDFTPLIPMNTEFEGTGGVDVARDQMAVSLLGTAAGGKVGTGGGLGNKKFQKLPKIPKAKFEMAKFEKAEFKPFEGERNELERRAVTDAILNWAPDAVTYAPHCLARESREKIIGAEPVEGDHYLTAEERDKDVVGACYHALGVGSGGEAAVETWGEEGTPGKKNTIWQGPYGLIQSSNPSFPGLTADAVWDCSSRDIERNYKLGMWEHDYDFKTFMIEKVAQASRAGCGMIPGVVTLAGAIAAYAGTELKGDKICEGVVDAMEKTSLFVHENLHSYRQRRFIESDYRDCNPLQNTMAKVYCDLACVEDAVKRGDQQILSSIGTLNNNILSEMKAFFDHYVTEIFTRLTHMEDKSSHESAQLKEVMDQYARAQIDAVNANGQQLTKTMNTQHSALNQNLISASEQIFDLTHSEHKAIAEKMDAHLEATSDAIDRLKESSENSFSDAFEAFTESLSEDAGTLLSQLGSLQSSASSALEELGEASRASTSDGGIKDSRQVHLALTALQRRVAESRRLQNFSNSSLEALGSDARALHDVINVTAHQLLGMKRPWHASASDASQTAGLDSDIQRMLRSVSKVMDSHRSSTARMGRHVNVLRQPLPLSQTKTSLQSRDLELHVESQLVEFDKVLVNIRQSAEDYMEAASEQQQLVSRATELTEMYLSQCSADFMELQLAAERAAGAGQQAAKAVRRAVSSTSQQVGLLADMMVDGGLVRHAVERAVDDTNERTSVDHLADLRGEDADDTGPSEDDISAAELLHAALGHRSDLLQRLNSSGAAHASHVLLQQPEFHRAVQIELLSKVASKIPAVLPKARAAFNLAQELSMRHDSHGLGRQGASDFALMQQAWEKLDAQIQSLADETLILDTQLGAAFATHVNLALEHLVPAPSECLEALASAGKGKEGWTAWGSLPGADAETVLVKGAAHFLQHTANHHHRARLDLAAYGEAPQAGVPEALVCSAAKTSSSAPLRSLRKGEFVLCFARSPREETSDCSAVLKTPDVVDASFLSLLW